MALTDDLSANSLRTAFSRFPSGVAALCAIVDGEPRASSPPPSQWVFPWSRRW